LSSQDRVYRPPLSLARCNCQSIRPISGHPFIFLNARCGLFSRPIDTIIMADANKASVSSTTRAQDEDSDHVESGTNTPPPGISTPRPDFTDKRLPGITNNTYFAQVCPPPRAPPRVNQTSTASSPLPSTNTTTPLEHVTCGFGGLPTAPNSRKQSSQESADPPSSVMSSQGQVVSPPHSLNASVATLNRSPPISPAPSMYERPREGGRPCSSGSHVSSSSGATHQPTTTPTPPSHMRRKTFSSQTLASVVTEPRVSAHISNPASQDSQPSPGVACSVLPPESRVNKPELTKAVNRAQTPPQTPRALSQHEPRKAQQPEQRSGPQVEPQQLEPQKEPSEDSANAGKAQAPSNTDLSSRSSSTSNPPVSATKGTLSVNIIQGRGLRPSTAPYVVCIYQLNEDISDGPQGDAMDTRQDQTSDNNEENLAKGVAMRRMGSDQGKPMAIPGLPSRQSSQTDIAKLRGNHHDHEVTDPVWKHEATL